MTENKTFSLEFETTWTIVGGVTEVSVYSPALYLPAQTLLFRVKYYPNKTGGMIHVQWWGTCVGIQRIKYDIEVDLGSFLENNATILRDSFLTPTEMQQLLVVARALALKESQCPIKK